MYRTGMMRGNAISLCVIVPYIYIRPYMRSTELSWFIIWAPLLGTVIGGLFWENFITYAKLRGWNSS